MNPKTLETFFKAGNVLLKEKFSDDDSAIIIITTSKNMTHAIKGKPEAVGYALYELASKDDGLFHVMKHAVEYIEKEKKENQP